MTTSGLDDELDAIIDVVHHSSSTDVFAYRIATLRLLAELVRATRELVEQQKIANDIADQALSDIRNTRMRGP
jgi:hypothetical protein